MPARKGQAFPIHTERRCTHHFSASPQRFPLTRHGIDYLLKTQRSDGQWDEELATGTGFPKVFYLNYHLYELSFPIIALATVHKALCDRL